MLNPRRLVLPILSYLLFGAHSCLCHAQAPVGEIENYPSDVLTPEKWQAVDASIERSLAWLASKQQPDGSFPTLPSGQPAVTSLCVMAFLAAGHEPGRGQYGEHIERAIKFAMSTQRDDGLFTFVQPTFPVTSWRQPTHTAIYNHVITALMLSETYGMSPGEDLDELTTAIEKAIEVTYKYQRRPGPNQIEDGGWRYIKIVPGGVYIGQADLSVTGWQLMFLRSAANAGFDIDTERVEAAAEFVTRCFDEKSNRFLYGLMEYERVSGRGMVGAGILSLAMAGQHDTKIARRAGDWLLQHPVKQYNRPVYTPGDTKSLDRFHYGVHYASHATYQLGGRYWIEFYPTMVDTMLAGQKPSGAWERESVQDGSFGNVYTTALAILSLTPPYQVLPIYQR